MFTLIYYLIQGLIRYTVEIPGHQHPFKQEIQNDKHRSWTRCCWQAKSYRSKGSWRKTGSYSSSKKKITVEDIFKNQSLLSMAYAVERFTFFI